MRKKLKKPVVENFDDRARRFTAYVLDFGKWIINGQQKILPACVYAVIRNKFSAQTQDYNDFIAGENEDLYM